MPDAILLAALAALDSFNKFLATPAGQSWMQINNGVATTVLSKLHIHIAPDAPAK